MKSKFIATLNNMKVSEGIRTMASVTVTSAGCSVCANRMESSNLQTDLKDGIF